MIFSIFYAIENRVLKVEFDEDDYDGINRFSQLLIITFRNSIGDIQEPQYQNWIRQDNFTAYIVIYFLWALWFVNIVQMMVLFFNFLIAMISQTYEKVIGSQTNFTYKNRAQMNVEAMTILSILGQVEIKMIVFSQEKNIWDREDKQWGGVVDSVKTIINENGYNLNVQMHKYTKSLAQNIEDVRSYQQGLQDVVDDVKKSQNNIQQENVSKMDVITQELEQNKNKIEILGMHMEENKDQMRSLTQGIEALTQLVKGQQGILEMQSEKNLDLTYDVKLLSIDMKNELKGISSKQKLQQSNIPDQEATYKRQTTIPKTTQNNIEEEKEEQKVDEQAIDSEKKLSKKHKKKLVKQKAESLNLSSQISEISNEILLNASGKNKKEQPNPESDNVTPNSETNPHSSSDKE